MTLTRKLAEERRARLAAERLLDLKQAELSAANRKLGLHAEALSNEIVETRAEVETVRDENQRVKTDLVAANEKIEIAERRLWLSIETIQDGFAFFDARDRMIGANHAYLKVFDGIEEIQPGVPYSRILEVITEEGIFNIGEERPEAWREMMLSRWHQPAPPPLTLRLWNGEYIKLIDQRGHGGDIVSLALNITETVEYEAKLKAEQARAEAASRAKSAFLANMSHEIRTPMNGIVGMADLLKDSALSDEQDLFVQTIKNSAEALLVIINDVLDYSKIEAEKLVLHSESFDFERCIHEVVTLLQPTAREKGLSLVVDYDLFLPTMFVGDPGRLRQVMTNLIGNAVKFTGAGHVLVRVVGTTDTSTGHCELHVTVEDSGIGIPADKIDHVFGEFNQVDDARNRQFEGTGLGLSITKRLIALMGGEIWVDSVEGEGASFGFRVSLAVDEDMSLAPPALPKGICKVLIVDDKAINRTLLQKQMEQMGARVTLCNNAREAADLIDGVDLVLAEEAMPRMGGAALVEVLRERGWTGPIVLLSDDPAMLGKGGGDPQATLLKTPAVRRALFRKIQDLVEGEAAKPVPELRGKTVSEGVGRAMRILAAEDNKTNRLVLGKLLKSLDIDLRFAENGIEAVRAFETERPDLIFMDISMPKMDGKEATRKIREIEGDCRVPIIALTAHAVDGDEENILSAGLDHYLTKPLRKDAIFNAIALNCPPGTRDPFPEEARPTG